MGINTARNGIYIKLGKRVRATIRQLGYPAKNALKGWFREYEQGRDLARAYARPEPKYSQAQKECGGPHGRVAGSSMKRQDGSPPGPEREELERQLEELRREVRRLQLEQDLFLVEVKGYDIRSEARAPSFMAPDLDGKEDLGHARGLICVDCNR